VFLLPQQHGNAGGSGEKEKGGGWSREDCQQMSISPEHALQVMIVKAVRAHVPMPHFFFSVDRSKKTGAFTHVREKARGMIAGTPDTVLVYPDHPVVAIELKAKGRKVDADSNQERVGYAIQAAGGLWGWCDSVASFLHLLKTMGIPLVGAWQLTAANYDAVLESAAIRREEAGGKVSKRRFRAPKAPAAKIKASERVRSQVLF
jgi:hypothetical protein